MRDLKQRYVKVIQNASMTSFLYLISSSFCYGDDPKSTELQFVDSIEGWIEKNIQESSIITPSALSRKKVETPPEHYTLREAINQAQQQHPGTVLGVNRATSADGALIYRVKILSADGVVNVVNIQGLKAISAESEIKKEQKQED